MADGSFRLDQKKLDEIKGNLGAEFNGFIENYIESVHGYMSELKKGLFEKNATQVAGAAEQIKTSSAHIGGNIVSEFAKNIKEQAESGNLETLNTQLDEMKEAFESLTGLLREQSETSNGASDET